jgi:ATP/ADP translocase
VKTLIIKVLNARPEEVPSVKLMLYLGFFIGVFLATYDVAAPAIFLNYFADKNVLAQAFLVSGFIGVIGTYIYSYLQARIPYKILVYGFITMMLVTTITIWMLSAFREQQGIIVFVSFVLALPFTYLSLLIFWGFFGRVFNLKQAKRIIGGIDTGQLVASIIALFTIGFVINRHLIETLDLFVVSILGVIGMLLVAVAMPLSPQSQAKHVGSVKNRTVSIFKLFTGKYTKLMAAFVVISLISVTFIDYSFLNVINIQWTTEAEKASFLANFEAMVVIFSFLFQTFITDWIIENYGLKVSLLINPILAIIMATGAVLTGFLMGSEPGPEINMMWFFLAIAASKLFIDSLKDALDGPSFKLYFLPINPKVKFDVSTKIEGFITALGGLLAGGILILMNQLNLSLIYILIGVIPILIVWFIITREMYLGYRTTLRSALKEGKASKKEEMNTATLAITDQLNDLKLLEKTFPLSFEQRILQLANTDDSTIKDYAEKKIASLDLNFDQKSSTVDGMQEIRALANQAVNTANTGDLLSVSDDRLYQLAKSNSVKERILAAKLLRSLVNDSNIFVLLELLRDPNNSVRGQAIITARKVSRVETWPLLLELLNHRTFTFEASSALIAAGEIVLPVLENAFHRSGQTLWVMLKIVNIIVEIGGKQAHHMLWQKIDFPDRKIVKQILISLRINNYKATSKEVIVLSDILNDEIGKALWNITAKAELSDAEYNIPLQNALDEEIVSNFEFIYIVLAIIYDPESIELIKENIEAGTTEGSAYAIELLDIFLDPDLKPKLFPLLDDISAKEKLAKLQIYFPRQWYEERDTYNYLLNRETNNVNRWTKACTLYAISQNDDYEIDDSIVSHMFNPDHLLTELATWITYKNKPAQYKSVVRRIANQADTIDRIIRRVENNLPLVFDLVLAIRKMKEFDGFSGLLISQLVRQMNSLRIKKGTLQILKNSVDEIYILQSGKLKTNYGTTLVVTSADGSNVIAANFSDLGAGEVEVEAIEESILLTLPQNDFFDILTNYPHLIKQFISTVSQQYTETQLST